MLAHSVYQQHCTIQKSVPDSYFNWLSIWRSLISFYSTSIEDIIISSTLNCRFDLTNLPLFSGLFVFTNTYDRLEPLKYNEWYKILPPEHQEFCDLLKCLIVFVSGGNSQTIHLVFLQCVV